MSKEAFRLGDEFCRDLPSFQRPVIVLAHHDDEISTAGLVQRLGPGKRAIFTTNSDGLYFESDLTPADYSAVRVAEGYRSMALLGIPPEGVTNLGISEVETYRRFAWLYSGEKTIEEVKPYFQAFRDAVRDAVFALKPDAVFTQAWQGGQPEHDLTHFFTMLAVRDLVRETGVPVPLYHLPAYEYTVAIAFRFHPLYRGTRLRFRLTPEELALKVHLTEVFASQAAGFAKFRKVVHFVAPLGRPFGGPRTLEELMAVEELGLVPADLDYAKKPHRWDRLTYMFDDFEGTRVTFVGSVRPIVQA
jgi:LmbE family N-acetylglucosaminyl deacetylase